MSHTNGPPPIGTYRLLLYVSVSAALLAWVFGPYHGAMALLCLFVMGEFLARS